MHSQRPERFCPAVFSQSEHLIVDKMQADPLRQILGAIKMAPHGIANHFIKFRARISLSEDARADCMGNKATVGFLFNNKRQFFH